MDDTPQLVEEYCGRWGGEPTMRRLFYALDGDRKTRRKVSRLVHRFDFMFGQIDYSDLSTKVKARVLLSLVQETKKTIYLTHGFSLNTKNSVYYHVITRFRKWLERTKEFQID